MWPFWITVSVELGYTIERYVDFHLEQAGMVRLLSSQILTTVSIDISYRMLVTQSDPGLRSTQT